jgi:hypothetical protein
LVLQEQPQAMPVLLSVPQALQVLQVLPSVPEAAPVQPVEEVRPQARSVALRKQPWLAPPQALLTQECSLQP